MRTRDRIFMLLGSLALLLIWFRGYERAAAAGPVNAAAERVAPPAILASGGAEGGSLAIQGKAGGIRYDPATGRLLGAMPDPIQGVEPLTWEMLRTYEYQPGLKGLPPSIARLDGKKVVMLGFLMAIFEYDDIHEFHLVANHWSCCYGVPPGLDGAVQVKMAAGEEGLPNTIKPLRVIGTLHVGEIKESDIVYAIYSMHEAKVLIMDY